MKKQASKKEIIAFFEDENKNLEKQLTDLSKMSLDYVTYDDDEDGSRESNLMKECYRILDTYCEWKIKLKR